MNGALDEWLSHRSAKPSTAVRIRQAPHFGKISTTPADIFLFYSQQIFLQMWAQRKMVFIRNFPCSVEISRGKDSPKKAFCFC